MPKGLSLHIGVDHVNPATHRTENGEGWDGALYGPTNDARAMEAIAKAQHFQTRHLYNQNATTQNLVKELQHAARQLEDGDIFFLTFSGHGGQTWDRSGDEARNEAKSLQRIYHEGKPNQTKEYATAGGKDETLCLYDRDFWDDELYRQLAPIKAGVRILYIADCCHAASNFKGLDDTEDALPPIKGLGIDKSMEILNLSDYYDDIWEDRNDYLKSNPAPLRASLIQFAACKAEELSRATNKVDGLSVFTDMLVHIWGDGQWQGTYQDLIDQIQASLRFNKADQTPLLMTSGADTDSFKQQRPFTI